MLRDQLRGKERPKAVEVECPEFPDADGAPAKLLFRSRLTVEDVIALAEFEAPFAPMRFELLLFHMLALDATSRRCARRSWRHSRRSGKRRPSGWERGRLACRQAGRLRSQGALAHPAEK